MKRINTIALVVLAVLATSTVASASEGHRPPKAQAKPWKVIRLIERIHDVTTVDEGAPGPSLGDRVVFTSDLFDHDGNKVGRDGADCVVVRIDPAQPPQEQQIVHCSIAAELPDGQLTVQGLAQGLENLFAVTGGTGSYRTARGEAFARDRVFLQEAEVTIRLFR